MIKILLSDDVQSFIADHYSADPLEILLKHQSVFGLPTSLVVDQLIGRKKAKDKLPTWYGEKKIVYPPALNIEQASSEKAALTKIRLLQKEFGSHLNGKTMLDLTGGFGVDSYYFSKVFKDVHIVEPNSALLEICKYNHGVLGATNIHYHNTSAESFLEGATARSFDIVFADPSRRISGDKKVFSLNDCEPNVITLQQRVWECTTHFFVKTSPLLDLQAGMKELNYVKTIWVTSVRNDCKELVFLGERHFQSEPTITALNINGEDSYFTFVMSDERSAENNFSDPLEYLYEPNASLLKSGAFKILGVNYSIPKLNPNTHLFTSTKFIDQFPGRVFQIEAIVKPDSKKILKYFEYGKANILTRNYPLSVDEIRRRTLLKEGGSKFLIGCSGIKEKFLLVAARLK